MAQHTAMDTAPGSEPGDRNVEESLTAPAASPIRIVMATLAFLVPIAVAIAVVFVLSGRSDGGSATPTGKVWSFVVPAGAKAKADKGEYVEDVLPEQLTIAVGDTVTILNQDSAVHTFGPFTVRPGEFQKMTFTEPGYFFGVCTVGGHETVTITVT